MDKSRDSQVTTTASVPHRLQGTGVCPGVVIGSAFVINHDEPQITEREIGADQIDQQISIFEEALIETRRQIRDVQQNLGDQAGVRDARLLDAHLMVLDDRAFVEEVITRIRTEKRNVEWVVGEVSGLYIKALSAVQDDYLRERVADIKDVSRRIIRNITGEKSVSLADIREKRIVIAHDLAPSETAGAPKDLVLGFATELGSPTSHTALMARALEIPAIVGLHNVTGVIMSGDEVLIDGNRGILVLKPTEKELEEYGRVAATRQHIVEGFSNLKDQPAETTDGKRIVLSANAENIDEIDSIVSYGAEGIGLFRTEYLCMSGSRDVSESSQTRIYSEVAKRLAPAPVIIRTMDIGGDKYLDGDDAEREPNPFLGCRSIRLSLRYPDVFKEQLRAILRASADGCVRLMYPMISSEAELDKANALLEECKDELRKQQVDFDEDIQTGIMIEIPGAALMAERLARKVSFFSIGTNDLIQYTLAVDRVNDSVAYLYDPTHPGVLELIRLTIRAAHKNKIWCGVCGEMGANPLLVPVLIGMGIDELSVAPSVVPLIKDVVRKLSLKEAEELAKAVASTESSSAALKLCRDLLKRIAPEVLELI